ncbi:MAG: cAMP-activated global transcriptional regulator CRP [Chromatiales bacterium]|jgi:CRP/FNR family cyclic AMP-dependent transcriptional regulator|nr:cAMP-activated global transcriptional regulator CRP [Chromatiales bacterium]MDX9768533.1 cAMP-activated global transcriptional regulator CRP [Ectothiorhodospiraceae bacterium]
MKTQSLLKTAPDTALDKLLSNAHIKRYAPRMPIVRPGDRSETLYYIIQGSVSLTVEDEQGHTLVMSYLNPGHFFGEMGIFSTQTRGTAVTARNACEIAEIHYSRFLELAMQEPRLLMMLAGQMASRLNETHLKVMDLAFTDVAGRIEHTLHDLCRQPDAVTHPEGMQIRITRQEIARIVGCSREMAGRALKELEEQGKIHAHGKTIVVFGVR